MEQFWTDVDRERLKKAGTFREAASVALTILERMGATGIEIVQVCGPMTTGGFGNYADNMAHFRRAVDRAIERGLLVFDQIAFQEALIRLCEIHTPPGAEYDYGILEEFYRPIFESGHLGRTLYLQDWQSSKGTTWERGLAGQLGISIGEYPVEWLA